MSSEQDRELLELAAKSAGLEVSVSQPSLGAVLAVRSDPALGWFNWNPLTDDGDALRLAVKLELLVHVMSYQTDVTGPSVDIEEHGTDRYANTRRCITRAAAELAKGEGKV